jgi:hypothetical protein
MTPLDPAMAVSGGAGTMNQDGSYNGALCPRDNAGVACWEDGVCDATATHISAP